MLLGNNDAISLIKLPLPQQHKAVGEVPNKFFRGKRRHGGKFLTKKAVGQREKILKEDNSGELVTTATEVTTTTEVSAATEITTTAIISTATAAEPTATATRIIAEVSAATTTRVIIDVAT